MKKINYIIFSSFPKFSGGRENWLYSIIREMHKLGYRQVIFSYYCGGKKFYSINNIQKYATINSVIIPKSLIDYYLSKKIFKINKKSCLGPLESFNKIYKLEKLSFILNSCLYMFFVFIKALFTISNNSSEIIISVGSFTEAKTALLIKKFKPKIKVIISVRGNISDELSMLASKRFIINYEKKLLKKADMVLANGVDTKNRLSKHGVESIVLSNGVDIKLMTKIRINKKMASEKYIKIISVATLRDIKGIPHLIKALSLIPEKYKIKCYFIGKGNVNKYYHQAVKNNVEDRVIFLGEKKNIASYVKASDIICCISGGSGLSMSLLEAMSSNRPIVAWDSPVYTQILKNQHNAILAKNNNSASLAQKFILLIKDKNIGKKIANQSRKDVTKYDWERIGKQLSFLISNHVNNL